MSKEKTEQKQKQSSAFDPIVAGTTTELKKLFNIGNIFFETDQKGIQEQAKNLARKNEEDIKQAKAEAEIKAKDEAEIKRQKAIGEIAVAIIFGGQENMSRILKKDYQKDEVNYKENLRKKISEHDITMDDILKEIKEKQTLDNMYIGSLNKIVTQGIRSSNTGEAGHKEELNRYNKMISEHQKNNRNIPKIVTNIIDNFKFVEQVLDEKNRTPSEASEPSTPESKTSGLFEIFKNFIKKTYKYIFKSSEEDYTIIRSDDDKSTRSFSSTTSSSESEGSKSSTNSRISSTIEVIKQLISSGKKGNTSIENQGKQAVNKIKSDTPEILKNIVSNISTKLQQINDDAIQQYQARAEEHKNNLEKIESDKAKKESEQAKQDEKKEENQRRKASEEKKIKETAKVLANKYKEEIDKLPKKDSKDERVFVLTIKDKKTKQKTTFEITAKDFKRGTSSLAETLAKETIKGAYSLARDTKDIAKGSYDSVKFITAHSSDSESIFKTLNNMTVSLSGGSNISSINFTECLPDAAQYFKEGIIETPGASVRAVKIGHSITQGAASHVGNSFKNFVGKIRDVSVRISTRTHQR